MSADTLTTVEDCLRAIRDLQTELDEFRQQVATEVRTRRLVVEAPSGDEVIYTEVGNNYAQLCVDWKGELIDGAQAVLQAGIDLTVPESFVYVSAGGDIGAALRSSMIFDEQDAPRTAGEVTVSSRQYWDRSERRSSHQMLLTSKSIRSGRDASQLTAGVRFEYEP